jgi:hypothetical protein
MGGTVERRLTRRRVPHANEPLARVRLRTGRDVDVCDVSDGGVEVEGRARLLPGTHVDVHVVVLTGRVLVRCRVVRSVVSRLDAAGVSYRSALAFQQPVDTRSPGYGVPGPVGAGPTEAGSLYPATAADDGAGHEKRLSA